MSVGGEMVYLEPINSNILLAFHWETILNICTTTCTLALRLTYGGPQCSVHHVYSSEVTSEKCIIIISQLIPVYPRSNVQIARQLPIAN